MGHLGEQCMAVKGKYGTISALTPRLVRRHTCVVTSVSSHLCHHICVITPVSLHLSHHTSVLRPVSSHMCHHTCVIILHLCRHTLVNTICYLKINILSLLHIVKLHNLFFKREYCFFQI